MADTAPLSDSAVHMLARRVQAALVSLTRESLRRQHDLPSLLRQITEVVAQTLQVSRVSIWHYRHERRELVCQEFYCAGSGEHFSGAVLATADFPGYFAALEERGVVAAGDARTDPQTREFAAGYLEPLGITSMLDVPIHLFEQHIGVLCHEHIGPPRLWRDDEQTFAVAAANLISLALERAERHKTEEQLRASEAKYRSLVETSNELIWSVDVDGRWTFVNRQAARRIYGYEPEEMLGRPFTDFQSPEQAALDLEAFARVKAGQPVFNYETTHRRKDGRPIFLSCNAVILRDDDGRVAGTTGTATDITERTAAERVIRDRDERLRQQQAQLNHVSRLSAVGEMVAGITHELQQPLYAIANFAASCTHVLEGVPAEGLGDVRHWTAQISLQAQRAKQILSRLRDFTRKTEFAKQSLDLNAVLADTLEFMGAEAARRRVTLEHALHPGGSLPIEGDAVQLQQVFVNLIQNAFESVEESPEPSRRVQVELAAHPAVAVAEVRDWGCGLPQGVEPERLFEPFYTTKRNGLGVGLAITRTIVEEHGGRITVAQMPDAGVSVQVELPLQFSPR